jgi:transcriptional regulator with XRE-family HTH domain
MVNKPKNPKPLRCIHAKPAANSVLFCGEFIHLPSIHLYTGISVSYLSLIFNLKRNPTVDTAEKIATALNMGLEAFLFGLRGHVRHYNAARAKAWRSIKAKEFQESRRQKRAAELRRLEEVEKIKEVSINSQ